MFEKPLPAADDNTAQLTQKLHQARLAYFESDTKLYAVLESGPYGVTKCFYALERRFPRAAQLLIRTLKLAAWSLSGDLPRYLAAVRRRTQLARTQVAAVDDDGVSISGAPLPPSPGGGTILVADFEVCKPDRHAGARAVFNTVSALRAVGWSVVVWAEDRLPGGSYTQDLEAMGVVVLDARWRGGFRDWLNAFGATLDLAMIIRPDVASLLLADLLRSVTCPLVYQGSDLHFSRVALAAKQFNDPLLKEESEHFLALERRIWRSVDLVLYYTADDAAGAKQIEPNANVGFYLPFCFDHFIRRTEPPIGHDILFVGGFAHPPNVDGVLWFAKEILPLVRARVPSARLVVIGAPTTAAIDALAGADVDLRGSVDDAALQGAYAACRISVAPLRYGSGIKGKVVEALAHGLPVVTTTFGTEGMPGLSDIVPTHSDADAYAEAVVRLLQNDAAWAQQSAAQSDYAETHFSRAALRRGLFAALGVSAPV